ncbi:MAG: hypothetical protein ACI4AH_00040 [Muribaculaceae bacterium]
MKTIIVNCLLSCVLGMGCCFAVNAQGVIKQVDTSSATDILNRIPANATYVYPEFREGVAYLRNGDVSRAWFNYCMLLDEMHYRLSAEGEVQALSNGADVGFIKIGNDAFYYVGKMSFAQLVVYDDDAVLCYRRHTRIAQDDGDYGAYGTATETVSAMRVQSVAFKPSLKDLDNYRDLKYDVENEYILMVDGKPIVIRSAKAFEKAFPKLKKQIKDYMSANKVNFKRGDDIVALMEFCITNK